MEDSLLQCIAYVLPATVTGFITYYMFKSYLFEQNTAKKHQLLMEKKKDSLPIKLQAYERMLLFCERIHPLKIMIRIQPVSDQPTAYVSLLILTIEQEFEYNLVQQLYISDDAFKAVLYAKNSINNKFQQLANSSNSIAHFKELVFKEYTHNSSFTDEAIVILKNEVKKLI